LYLKLNGACGWGEKIGSGEISTITQAVARARVIIASIFFID
jgi:hypothetical protein